MEANFVTATTLGSNKYPKSSSKYFEYGTAGFRDKAKELSPVMYRMGLLAVIRSKAVQGSTIGLMITASHNPEEDNGVKLCDPLGDMLEQKWEKLATELVNVSNEALGEYLLQIVKSCQINYAVPASVFIGNDTRSSSPVLAAAALDGIQVLSGQVKNFGLITTPQLHYLVCCKNDNSYGQPTVENYCLKLSGAFEKLRLHKTSPDSNIYVDCANGVGATALTLFLPHISSLNINLFNTGPPGVLNFKCGADYIKVQQMPPEGTAILSGKQYASLDGDADRLIFFYVEDNVFKMLDGDKIATLIAMYLKELVDATGLSLSMRVIQTAYANGSSTNYIEKDLGIPVICTSTGVKHLHSEAKKYDIGVYFEANGHGTVVFSKAAKEQIKKLAVNNSSTSESQCKAAIKLSTTIDLINETVGDAIADLLLVQAILQDKGWSIADWDKLYTDLPNRQLKVKVPDRNKISTTNADRICVEPKGLQDEIDATVSGYSKGRSFVRPSGTENIVRVYTEADTQANADKLADEIKALVIQSLP